MVSISLPDGARRDFPEGATGATVAEGISKSLAKKAVAMRVNGALADLADRVPDGGKIEIVTRDDAAALELIRHDCAHVLAEAVQALFPGTQVTIGPVVENGFYYDFFRNEPFSTEDFSAIEAKMREIVAKDRPFTKEVWDRERTRKVFRDKGEMFKVELVDAIPEGEDVKVYFQGDWFDLCRGPHMPSTGFVGDAFKLTKLAGAYWRGDSNRQQLQRIYGTAWPSKKELDAYLTMLDEAEKRDHRRIGREMGLFHFQEEAQGSVFWHPKGFAVWRVLEAYMRRRLDADGYVEVKTPQLLDSKLWEQSGHWSKFRENMFVVPDQTPSTDEHGPIIEGEVERWMALKPMNCPAHVQIFKQGIKSYRDLPIRMAEFGCCHRNEPHGALHGLMRVRQMTQDDAHIFCTDGQVTDETRRFLALFARVYSDMGLTEIRYKLATRPAVKAGDDAVWDRAEKSLADALTASGIDFELAPGEGAFYGPKLEFHLTDAIGRTWQCGTYQLDYVIPERLDATYVGEDGGRYRPVMLHRAVLGSFERFLGILLEHYAGRMPLWLSPVQAVVATITSDADAYAKAVAARLEAAGIRAVADLRNEKINYKVREHSVVHVPLILVVGRREAEEGTISIRRRGAKEQQVIGLDSAVNEIAEEATPPDLRPSAC
ncbi:MAG: threonine--tRNA ligase [Propylenella sp.]